METRMTVRFQRDKILLDHLESQLKIEKARFAGLTVEYLVSNDAVIFCLKHSICTAIREIECQIKELKSIKYSDTPPHLRNKKK